MFPLKVIFHSGDFLGNALYQAGLPPVCFRSYCLHFWEHDSSATSSIINSLLGSYSVGVPVPVPPGLCWKVVVSCRAGKRLGYQAQEKCLWQGCLDAQSSLCQVASGLLTDILSLGSSEETQCGEHEGSRRTPDTSLVLTVALSYVPKEFVHGRGLPWWSGQPGGLVLARVFQQTS